jgi:two-component system sensor histidine kinase UhpB
MATVLIVEEQPLDRTILRGDRARHRPRGSQRYVVHQRIRHRHRVAPEIAGGRVRHVLTAIERIAQDFERRAGIRCRVDARAVGLTLDPAAANAVVTIVQEALTNVLRHARATRATVTVRRYREVVAISVTDNGRGIPALELTDGRSLGLIGMRERAALLGGGLRARRRRRRGTIVTLTMPVAAIPGRRVS